MELFKPYDYLRRLDPDLYLIDILISVPKGYKANVEDEIISGNIFIQIDKILPDPLNGVAGYHPMKPLGTEVFYYKKELSLGEEDEITITVSIDHGTYIGIPFEFLERIKIRDCIRSAIKVINDLHAFIKKCKESIIDQAFLRQNIIEVERLISESETVIESVNDSSIEDADYVKTIIQPITGARDILEATPAPILQTTSSQDADNQRPPSPNDVDNFNQKLEHFKQALRSYREIPPKYRLSKIKRRTKGADSEDRDV